MVLIVVVAGVRCVIDRLVLRRGRDRRSRIQYHVLVIVVVRVIPTRDLVVQLEKWNMVMTKVLHVGITMTRVTVAIGIDEFVVVLHRAIRSCVRCMDGSGCILRRCGIVRNTAFLRRTIGCLLQRLLLGIHVVTVAVGALDCRRRIRSRCRALGI